MAEKIRVAILLGGRSAEHEVSLQSARNVLRALNAQRYEVIPVAIDKDGVWRLADAETLMSHADDPSRIRLETGGERVGLLPWPDPLPLVELDGGRRHRVDVVFPVLHGPFGEDGAIQGLLDLAGVPYVGAGVLGSAAAMDKDVAKRLMREAGIPVARGHTLHAGEAPPKWERLTHDLGSPLFVKPANMGSSVGVHKVSTQSRLAEALADAFQYDTKIIIEEFIGGREIECSVLGNDRPEASPPGEVIPHHEFYSYAAKYLDPDGAGLQAPAQLSPGLTERVRDLAVRAFKTLCCHGMARVDFLLPPSGEVYVNEVNTIPGFTNISMYPRLWEAGGLPQAELMNRLIALALERSESRRSLQTHYQQLGG